MAKQDSVILIKGTIGELSFFKTRDGYFVRKKTCIPGARVKSDPAFARTRENAAEFAIAARAGKLLRTAFEPMMANVCDSRITGRLTGALYKVVRADTTHPAGQRTIAAQHTAMLQDFNFDRNGSLSSILRAEYTASIDRATNSFRICIPSFDPSHSMWTPPGATHFCITGCGVSANFQAGTWERIMSRSVDLSLDEPTPRELSLTGTIPGDCSHPIFLALSVEFVQRLKNQQPNGLHDHTRNAMAIIKVDAETDERALLRKKSPGDSWPHSKRASMKRKRDDRLPVARPFIPALADEPLTLRSIVAEGLKSPDTILRLINDRNTVGELSRNEQAALGLFKLSPSRVRAESSRERMNDVFARDGP